MKDRLEFYNAHGGLIVVCETSIVPPLMSFISVRGDTYKVVDITYAIDYADIQRERQMRVNITLNRVAR